MIVQEDLFHPFVVVDRVFLAVVVVYRYHFRLTARQVIYVLLAMVG